MFDFIRLMDERMGLMGRMAKATGASLPDALGSGHLGAEALRSAAQRCAACTSADVCADWLDSRGDGVTPPPGYCRNRELFAVLAGMR